MCDCCYSSYVDQFQRRIAWCFDPDKFCLVGPYEFLDVEFDARREGDLDAVGGGDLGEVAVRTAVDVGDGDDMRTRGEGLEDHGCCGRA